ncbi:hypothetical protein RUR49_05585 [Pseudoxanthobacter sp. M-2]|uniref:hypothetical protein n=1 Tax=Pseudoxanthobacter sp. M-2 TaxID=3078754 RepID=UPI0038FCF8DF
MIKYLPLLLLITGAAPETATAQSARHYNMEVEPGGTLNIGIHRSWDRDCTTGEVKVELVKAPKYGKVVIKIVPSKIPARAGHGRDPDPKCVGLPAPGTQVIYRADRKYKGEVDLAYISYFGNRRQKYSYKIMVR